MRGGDKAHNNFTSLILPYLSNSQNWHIREELLNVLIVCFLRSRNFYDFDAFKVVEVLLSLLHDSKARIKYLALEALACYSSIGNKFSFFEIVYQLVEADIQEIIAERIEQELFPYINEEGTLQFPFIDNIEN